ncbi:tRNA (guanosine(37)-N1)-methyltransferase TrmD [Desulfobacca acetoxidans]|uniref:tRNA (guanine-N(1)-)-methyltransferase n=1 Tax=Desulfobacca acetoxidans (strain ATCC 700848 / DSM 11109 / ASRB2) TaxID=880072 RepID=F2NF70_DESAR|nr:tRNA (guanosine(37)-N1)-methyltransferase TrmD [Desulfobacca acetoxidans]AEB08625.1 tRNA (guanine-N(1)-)-methyltransferase [Desulfobacca acetoxidans DSM 11109]
MQIDILTLFPAFFGSPLSESILKRAQASGIFGVEIIDLREFAPGRHQVVDDRPFGGGPGMVLKIEPLAAAIQWERRRRENARVILLSPQGRLFKQAVAAELVKNSCLMLVCGHYEGFDDRVRHYIDDEISLGDFILTGGEIPALAVLDAVVRLLPGALGDEDSAAEDSFKDNLLKGPQYTRPREFAGWSVPEILLSGDHQRVAQWRRREALRRTWRRRPDLLRDAGLTAADRLFLQFLEAEPSAE